jgi:hypothetical protein
LASDYAAVRQHVVAGNTFDNHLTTMLIPSVTCCSYLEVAAGDGLKDSDFDGQNAIWMEKKWELMKAQPWYRHDMKREAVPNYLAGQPPGTFIVRPSSRKGQFAISFVTPPGYTAGGKKRLVENMLILPSFAGANSTAPGNTRCFTLHILPLVTYPAIL